MAKPTVFVDSSVIISALLSSTGGRFYVLTQYRDLFAFQINEYALDEIQEILRMKFPGQLTIATDLFVLLGIAKVVVLPDPSKPDVTKAAEAISENDAPILASALRASDYLVTLDNEFFDASVLDRAEKGSLVIMKPKEFIEEFRRSQAA